MALKATNPDQYEFLKHNVFNGLEFIQDQISKQIETMFNQKGGLSALLEYCKQGFDDEFTQKVRKIVPKSSIERVVTETREGDKIKTSIRTKYKPYTPEEYLQNNECFEEYSRKILQSCDLTTELCEAGGRSMILGWLTDRYSGDLRLLLDKIVQATP